MWGGEAPAATPIERSGRNRNSSKELDGTCESKEEARRSAQRGGGAGKVSGKMTSVMLRVAESLFTVGRMDNQGGRGLHARQRASAC